jgi:hypothetical protein
MALTTVTPIIIPKESWDLYEVFNLSSPPSPNLLTNRITCVGNSGPQRCTNLLPENHTVVSGLSDLANFTTPKLNSDDRIAFLNALAACCLCSQHEDQVADVARRCDEFTYPQAFCDHTSSDSESKCSTFWEGEEELIIAAINDPGIWRRRVEFLRQLRNVLHLAEGVSIWPIGLRARFQDVLDRFEPFAETEVERLWLWKARQTFVEPSCTEKHPTDQRLQSHDRYAVSRYQPDMDHRQHVPTEYEPCELALSEFDHYEHSRYLEYSKSQEKIAEIEPEDDASSSEYGQDERPTTLLATLFLSVLHQRDLSRPRGTQPQLPVASPHLQTFLALVAQLSKDISSPSPSEEPATYRILFPRINELHETFWTAETGLTRDPPFRHAAMHTIDLSNEETTPAWWLIGVVVLLNDVRIVSGNESQEAEYASGTVNEYLALQASEDVAHTDEIHPHPETCESATEFNDFGHPTPPQTPILAPQPRHLPFHHRFASRKPLSDNPDCPVCLDSLENEPLRHITYCAARCGTNIHRDCMDAWIAAQEEIILETWEGGDHDAGDGDGDGSGRDERHVNADSGLGWHDERDVEVSDEDAEYEVEEYDEVEVRPTCVFCRAPWIELDDDADEAYGESPVELDLSERSRERMEPAQWQQDDRFYLPTPDYEERHSTGETHLLSSLHPDGGSPVEPATDEPPTPRHTSPFPQHLLFRALPSPPPLPPSPPRSLPTPPPTEPHALPVRPPPRPQSVPQVSTPPALLLPPPALAPQDLLANGRAFVSHTPPQHW